MTALFFFINPICNARPLWHFTVEHHKGNGNGKETVTSRKYLSDLSEPGTEMGCEGKELQKHKGFEKMYMLGYNNNVKYSK